MAEIYFSGGDLLEAEADVALCSIHRSKNLSIGPLARQFLYACGESVQREIYSQCSGDLKFGQVVTTSSGKMENLSKIKFICLHYYREGYELMLQQSLFECLEETDSLGYSSIVLPPIGTGGLHYPCEQLAAMIIQAVSRFNKKYPNSNVKDVTFILTPEDGLFATICFQYLYLGKDDKLASRDSCDGDKSSESAKRGDSKKLTSSPTEAKALQVAGLILKNGVLQARYGPLCASGNLVVNPLEIGVCVRVTVGVPFVKRFLSKLFGKRR